jgi:hypothetical protein
LDPTRAKLQQTIAASRRGDGPSFALKSMPSARLGRAVNPGRRGLGVRLHGLRCLLGKKSFHGTPGLGVAAIRYCEKGIDLSFMKKGRGHDQELQ